MTSTIANAQVTTVADEHRNFGDYLIEATDRFLETYRPVKRAYNPWADRVEAKNFLMRISGVLDSVAGADRLIRANSIHCLRHQERAEAYEALAEWAQEMAEQEWGLDRNE